MASNCFDDSLKILKSLETEWDLESPIKAQVQSLRMKASFLKAFLSCTGKWQIEDKNLKALLSYIETVVQYALKWLSIEISFEDIINFENMDVILSRVLKLIELIEPKMQEVYLIIPKSSRPICLMTYEAARELLDSVLQNMEDLLGADSIVPVQKEMEAVQKGLRFLRNFIGFTAGRCSRQEELKDLLAHVEIVVDSTVCLLYLCSINDKMGHYSVNEMKLELCNQLQKIELSQPEVRKIYIKSLKASESFRKSTPVDKEFFSGFLDSLLENMKELLVLDTKLCFNFCCKDQILALQVELAWLRCYLIISPTKDKNKKDRKLNDLLRYANTLVSKAGCIIYSFYDDDEIDEDMAKELNSTIFDLLSKAKVAKDDARKLYHKLVPKAFRSDFPRTNVPGFVNSHLQYLEELLISKADSVAPLKHDIKTVQKELSSLREDFSAIAKQPNEHQQLKKQWARYNDVAHFTECVIDKSFVGGYDLWIYKLGLFEAVEEIKEIRVELKDIKSKMTDESSMHRMSNFPTQVSLEADSPENAVLSSKVTVAAENKVFSKVVIFEDEAAKIKEQLTIGPKHLQVLSIVGMPGIGKTTLAASIFEHPSVILSFNVRARCCVTQVYRKRKLLLDILRQTFSDTNKLDETKDDDDDDLCDKLYKSLKCRKYLILMDDIWGIEPWKDIKYCFPDDKKGSRIIFTSRFLNIASQVETTSINYPLHPLTDDKSWDLLQVKTFGKENCPTGLMKLGQQIASYCKGLPLAIDLIAGILRLVERKENNWQQITATLTAKLLNDPQGRCMKVLELSYQNLPDHLKQCFLYFGAFAEDTVILATKLIQ